LRSELEEVGSEPVAMRDTVKITQFADSASGITMLKGREHFDLRAAQIDRIVEQAS
jgi:hypothetical protein